MQDIEISNWAQIQALNQRGGRDLSIIDLIAAGTLPLRLAAVCACATYCGRSILTCALRGGTGKTTLMGSLMMFMPPEEPIVTVSGPGVISQAASKSTESPLCALAHEIGSGSWFGYIWGETVREYFRLIDGKRRIVSCLHANTYDEARRILFHDPLNVPPAKFYGLGIVLFIKAFGTWGSPKRRVTAAFLGDGRRHHQICRYNARSDSFKFLLGARDLSELLAQATGLGGPESLRAVEAMEAFLQSLADADINEIREVRRLFLQRSPL